eukprot:GHVO01014063.1.p1 GENE.GHVO01014063.1~~GHVO01014063.1.p1  ORF type:complete len:150 (-),score=22.20 GHVO01014063.1:73-522(-)
MPQQPSTEGPKIPGAILSMAMYGAISPLTGVGNIDNGIDGFNSCEGSAYIEVEGRIKRIRKGIGKRITGGMESIRRRVSECFTGPSHQQDQQDQQHQQHQQDQQGEFQPKTYDNTKESQKKFCSDLAKHTTANSTTLFSGVKKGEVGHH